MEVRKQTWELDLRARQLWLCVGWTLVISVVYFSLARVSIETSIGQGDKLLHAFTYSALMVWLANLYEASARRMQFAIGFIALGVSLEFVQRWTGNRSFEVADMAASAAGVAVGWVFAPPRLPNYLHGMGKLFQRT